MADTPTTATGGLESRFGRYGVAVAGIAAAALLRWALPGTLAGTPYLAFYPVVVAAAALGGLGPGLLATFGSFLCVDLLFDPTPGHVDLADRVVLGRLAIFLAGGCGVSLLAEIMRRDKVRLRRAAAETERQRQQYAVTLASIGDAVLVTDTQGRIRFINPEAERLTGWTGREAVGQPVATVFRIINEETRQPIEHPVEKVLRLGMVVGLANHTVLIAKDGRETHIDDSGAPIRGADGTVHGVVLVFRDFSEQKAAERALRESEQRVRQKLDSILSPGGDLGNLQLADIIDVSAVQSLMADLHCLVNIPMAILDVAGNILVGVGWQDTCTQFHRVHPETCAHCLESDTQLSAGVAPGEFRLYKCKNNMWDMATPILVGSHHVGNLFTGQFFFDDEPVDRAFFRAQAAQYGFDEAKYLAAIDAVPRLSRETVNASMSFLTKLAQKISRLSYSNIKLARSLAEGERLAAQLRALVESLNEGVVAADLDGRIFHWNLAALAMHGYADDSECRRMLPDFADTFEICTLDGVKLSVDEWPLARILRGENVRDLELCLRHVRDGWERICNYAGALVHDADHQPLMAVLAISDITHRKMAEQAIRESREDLNRAQAVAQVGSWRMDVQHNRLIWSDENYRIFGVPQQTPLTYETFLGTVHPEDRESVDGKWKAALRGEPYDIEHRILAGGKLKWVREKAELEFDAQGVLLGGFGTTQDITGKKLSEEALAAAMTSAERAKAAAEEANKAKDHFLAVLSHELRTPLTPVLATVSVLQADEHVSPDIRQSLEVVRRNVEMEARLIDDLLDVTRIARGKIELHKRPVALGDVIRRAVEVCQPDIAARHLHLELDLQPADSATLDADPARLQQVFWNLIKNAIKFAPQGGHIGIRCSLDGGRHVVTEITDSGEGIEPGALARIFDAFEQAGRSITRQFGGLGLGLTISRTLVELHGGTISAHSEGRGQGATFRVRMPLSGKPATAPGPGTPQASTGPGAAPGQAPAVRPLRVLLVEDHADTARIMSRLLTRRGYEVHSAGDVTTALDVAESQSFDLLISDLGLPDRSGLELIGELRARGQHMPAIALSGYGQEEDVQRSRQAGFNVHLTKPVDFEQFYKAIAAAVR